MIQKFATILWDKRGNAAVEVAMVMPLVLMMALGGIDFGMGFRHKIEVQQHAQTGAEYVMGTLETLPAAVDVRQAISDSSGYPMGQITATYWIECDGVKPTVPAPVCVNPTAVKTQYLTITVSDQWTPMLNIDGIADFATTQTHVGSVTLRTE
ncbi:TadE/TadG family type IV pilus assembly protein [Qipengyuania psychrotolerans]|uniref:Pilus assembly protein n=1 Tax=Qipengyuania psychrotolerans TaxID=2867238 RepID=A0ABX8ZHM0_9SPHN|nr:TadE/TadG family type IV pilus assembly protein [Qipengyuania psychrotolerans]QZD88231.1 pilus assembly protein [Qipengyuania psychrotolerans]